MCYFASHVAKINLTPGAKIVSISKSSIFIRFIFMVDGPKLVQADVENEDSDQSARMRRLICVFVVRIRCTILSPRCNPHRVSKLTKTRNLIILTLQFAFKNMHIHFPKMYPFLKLCNGWEKMFKFRNCSPCGWLLFKDMIRTFNVAISRKRST